MNAKIEKHIDKIKIIFRKKRKSTFEKDDSKYEKNEN